MMTSLLSGCQVWRAERRGQAELAEARYSKQVIEIIAEQELIAETFRAEAEVVRAQGIAEAMEIISAQLTPEYLKHFWIRTIAGHDGVIYVSIEGGYPVLLTAMMEEALSGADER
jgi:phosphoribosylcarboxyaminoimidazole (NCAIR) mutase